MRVPGTVRWIGLALLGIVVAVAVAIAASRLASQQIGLASEPITAGDTLAPAVRSKPKRQQPAKRPPREPVPTAPSVPTITPPPESTSTAPTSPSDNGGVDQGGDGSHEDD